MPGLFPEGYESGYLTGCGRFWTGHQCNSGADPEPAVKTAFYF